MSYHEYISAKELLRSDPPFYALIQAAMRRADTKNAEKLRAAWPDIWAELDSRYHSPGGVLPDDSSGPEVDRG